MTDVVRHSSDGVVFLRFVFENRRRVGSAVDGSSPGSFCGAFVVTRARETVFVVPARRTRCANDRRVASLVRGEYATDGTRTETDRIKNAAALFALQWDIRLRADRRRPVDNCLPTRPPAPST